MSLLTVIDGLIRVLERVPGVQRAADAAAKRIERRLFRPRPVPIPFGRAHSFNRGLQDPPVCAYCTQELSAANEHAPCPGPPPRTQ